MMSKKLKILAGLGAVVVAAFTAFSLYMLTIAGEFRVIEPHFKGSCRKITGVAGPEDIQILKDGSGAFVTSLDRVSQIEGKPVRGTLYYYSLTEPNAKPVDLAPDRPRLLHPHGLAIYEGQETLLFVVNHPRADVHGDLPGSGPAHSIEVYAVTDATLVHRRTIVNEALLISPNDIAPVGPETFYVTNDHGSGDKLTRKLENYLRIARSHVLYYDGERFVRLPGTYGYANGIAASADGSQVYVASPTDRTVFVFDRDAETGGLELVDEVFVDSGPDNINVDPAGDLWIGAHPMMLTLSLYLREGSGESPSQVLRIDLEKEGDDRVQEVLLMEGEQFSASTSAARYGNRLLVGAVFGNAFLDCEIDD